MGDVKIRITTYLLLIGAAIVIFSTQLHADEFKHPSDADEIVLKPQVRILPSNNPLYKIKTSNIATYLENITVLDNEDAYVTLPYVVAFVGENNVGSAGDLHHIITVYEKIICWCCKYLLLEVVYSVVA